MVSCRLSGIVGFELRRILPCAHLLRGSVHRSAGAVKKGDRTPMHSHPSSVVYILKGGRVKYTLPDGSTKISELKTGETLLRPPVTHSDEALDDVDSILVELKVR